MSRVRRHPWSAGLIVTLALASLISCDRSPRFKSADADSTAMVPSDSNATYVQMARVRWDDPEQGGEAADLTARVVLQDLRNHPGAPIYDRARELLDSLTFGVETGGGASFVLTNLFARSIPPRAPIPTCSGARRAPRIRRRSRREACISWARSRSRPGSPARRAPASPPCSAASAARASSRSCSCGSIHRGRRAGAWCRAWAPTRWARSEARGSRFPTPTAWCW